ncbi:MAG: hypothetical protein JWM31_1047 [Solirubrobacterales bacterium]|nr:hypothetical protein [Solirubrobacterales bacterium]
MGRRSRSRTAATPAAARTPGKPASGTPARRERAFDRLSPVRRILARYLAAALVIGVATIAGIAGLGGRLGPLIVLAYVLVAAGVCFRWAQSRLAGQAMSDEDRMMQTMAGGMLVLSVLLAGVAALVLSLA